VAPRSLHPVGGAVLWSGLVFQTCTTILNNFFNNSGNFLFPPRRQTISEEDTFLWLSMRGLKAVKEGETIAAQDQALQKRGGGAWNENTGNSNRYQTQTMRTILWGYWPRYTSVHNILTRKTQQPHVFNYAFTHTRKQRWNKTRNYSEYASKVSRTTSWTQDNHIMLSTSETDRTISNTKEDIVIRLTEK
jgi:hypothetical protein